MALPTPLPCSAVAHALLCARPCAQAAMPRPRRLCPPLLMPSAHAALLPCFDLILQRSPFFYCSLSFASLLIPPAMVEL